MATRVVVVKNKKREVTSTDILKAASSEERRNKKFRRGKAGRREREDAEGVSEGRRGGRGMEKEGESRKDGQRRYIIYPRFYQARK
jgi:hypothetical protein